MDCSVLEGYKMATVRGGKRIWERGGTSDKRWQQKDA